MNRRGGYWSKSVRDGAILATMLYHGIQREELCSLKIKNLQSRQGVIHFNLKTAVEIVENE